MRFFLYSLMLLNFACGKHDSTPMLDFADDDGDEKANYEEEGLSAYVADVVPLEPVQGVLSIDIPGSRPKLIEFSNLRNFKERAHELLTRNPLLLKGEENFTEWSRLILKTPALVDSLNGSAKISLNFATRNIKAKSLWLAQDGAVQNLGTWKPEMQFALTREQLSELLKGKANLVLTNQWMERNSKEVKQKTYRVFYFDGKQGRVYYVSRKLPFSEFLKGFKHEPPLQVEGKDFFTLTEQTQPNRWWTRDLGGGDRIVAQAYASELINAYREGFNKSSKRLQMTEGKSMAPIYIQKSEAAMMYLKLKGSWTRREFEEKSEVVRHRSGGGREGPGLIWDCKYEYRSVRAEKTHLLGRETLLGIVDITDANGFAVDVSGHILEESIDKKGQLSITFAIPLASNAIKLELPRGLSKKAPMVGLFRHSCDRGYGPERKVKVAPVNEEKNISVEVESWVEKL